MTILRRITIIALPAIVATLVGSSDCFPRTWHVPSEHPTIFGAVDSASYGDTVLVAPGTYCRERAKDDGLGNAVWIEMKSGVTLMSEQGPNSTTLVETAPWFGNFVVYCDSVVHAGIQGFTMTRGGGCAGESNGFYTTGVEVHASDVTVEGSILSDFYWGIAISGDSGHPGTPVVRGNKMESCATGVWVLNDPALDGAVLERNDLGGCVDGIIVNNADPYIVENTISGCTYTGISFHGYSESLMESNVVVNNGLDGVSAVMDYAYQSPCLNCGWKKETANDVHGNGRYDVHYYEASGLGLFEARYNYWGTSCPESARFYGRVDWTPWVDRTHMVVCPDCASCPDAVAPTTWGAIKAMYR